MSTEPGRLAVVVPEGRGVLIRTCMVCGRAYGETECIPEFDGKASHGICGSICKARYLSGQTGGMAR